MLTLEQFDNYLNKLAVFDWYYDYSDDSRVWQSGKANRQALLDEASKHPILAQAFTAWSNFIFTKNERTKALLVKENILSKLRREITEPKE